MTELLRVFNETYKVRQNYCVICLRSGLDRQMVDTKNLKDFLTSINAPYNYSYDFQRVCWMCDRAAAAALRFRLAVRLSASLHSFLNFMAEANARLDVPAQLRGEKMPVEIVRRALKWERELLTLRARTTLLHTEVLVVASVPPANEPVFPSQPDESDVYLIPDEAPSGLLSPPAPLSEPPSPPASSPPSPEPPGPERTALPTHHALSEPEIYMDSVIIEDDERDPIEIPDPLTMPNESQLKKFPYKPELRPKKQTNKQNFVPNPPNPKVQSPSIVSLEKLLDNTENGSFLLHPIVESNGAMSVPSLNAQIVNGQLMTIDKSNLVLETPKIALQTGTSYNFVTEPNMVTEFLKTMRNNDFSKAAIVSNNMPSMSAKSGQNLAMTQTLAMTQSLAVANNLIVPPNLAENLAPGQTLVITQDLATGEMTLTEDLATGQLLISNQGQNITSQDMQSLMSGTSFSNNIMTHSIIIDDDDVDLAESRTEMDTRARQADADSNRRKRDRDKTVEEPPKKQRETDWEDKIPMDVISYMGAVDPNADALLGRDPALGVISAVQTVSEETHRNMDSGQVDSNRDLCVAGQTATSSQTELNSVQTLNSAQMGINSASMGLNSVQTLNKGTIGLNSGTIGFNSVQTLNSAQMGINSASMGFNSAQTLKTTPNNASMGFNSVQMLNSAQMGLNSATPGLSNVTPTVKMLPLQSAIIGPNTVQNVNSVKKIALKRVTLDQSGRVIGSVLLSGGKMTGAAGSIKTNKKAATGKAAQQDSDVIDLC